MASTPEATRTNILKERKTYVLIFVSSYGNNTNIAVCWVVMPCSLAKSKYTMMTKAERTSKSSVTFLPE